MHLKKEADIICRRSRRLTATRRLPIILSARRYVARGSRLWVTRLTATQSRLPRKA
jgi:hypothetical protein